MEEKGEVTSHSKEKDLVDKLLSLDGHYLFLAIFAFAIAIRIFFFVVTKDQPLWWDEADYLAYAKNIAGYPVDWMISHKHNSLFPYFVAALLYVGFSEQWIKIIVEIIPSIALVFLAYKLADLIYADKRISIITAFMVAVNWNILFNTMRFHLGIPGLFFGLLAVYVYWQGYEKKQNIFGKIPYVWAIPLSVILVVLTYSIRRGYFLFGIFIFLHMLSTKDFKSLLKDKYNWIAAGVVLVLVLIVESSIFISSITEVAGGYAHVDRQINFLPLGVFTSFFGSSSVFTSGLLYLFWIGFGIMLLNVGLVADKLKKIRDPSIRGDVFMIISIIVTLAFFILVLRQQQNFGEPRWYFPLFFPACIAIGRSSAYVMDKMKQYGSTLPILIIISILLLGAYAQVKQAELTITSRSTSFEGMRQAGFYLKEQASPEEKIVTLGQPQIEYYGERGTYHFKTWPENRSQEAFLEALAQSEDANFVVITFTEGGYPEWAMQRFQNQEGSFWVIPFMDSAVELTTGQSEVVGEKTFTTQYGEVTLTLLDVKQEVFIYKVSRNNTFQGQ